MMKLITILAAMLFATNVALADSKELPLDDLKGDCYSIIEKDDGTIELVPCEKDENGTPIGGTFGQGASSVGTGAGGVGNLPPMGGAGPGNFFGYGSAGALAVGTLPYVIPAAIAAASVIQNWGYLYGAGILAAQAAAGGALVMTGVAPALLVFQGFVALNAIMISPVSASAGTGIVSTISNWWYGSPVTALSSLPSVPSFLPGASAAASRVAAAAQ